MTSDFSPLFPTRLEVSVMADAGDTSRSPINEAENDMRLKSLIVHENGNVEIEESSRLASSSWQQNNNGYGSTSPSPSPSPERDTGDAVRCGCHVKSNEEDKRNRKARIKLVAACIIALFFVVGEVAG